MSTKNYGVWINKYKKYEAYFKLFKWAAIEINSSKGKGKSSKFALQQKFHNFTYFLCFNEEDKIMTKYIITLEVIVILQFSQIHLIFEINITKEIEKMIARNFNETKLCSFYVFCKYTRVWSLLQSLLWGQSCCLQSLSTSNHPPIFCNRPRFLSVVINGAGLWTAGQ